MMPENEVWVNADMAGPVRARQRRPRAAAEPGRRASAIPSGCKATQMIRPTASTWCMDSATQQAAAQTPIGKGASDAGLVTRYKTDPLMGGTGMNVNFVTFEFGGGMRWHDSAW